MFVALPEYLKLLICFIPPESIFDDAMKLADYLWREISFCHIRKSISKKKNRLLSANSKDNKKKTKAPTVVSTSTKTSSLLDLTSMTNTNTTSSAASKKDGTKASAA
jgi:hypothetical protein